MSMNDFFDSFVKGREHLRVNSLQEVFNTFCTNGLIIDINKSIYTPTQARNKISYF